MALAVLINDVGKNIIALNEDTQTLLEECSKLPGASTDQKTLDAQLIPEDLAQPHVMHTG